MWLSLQVAHGYLQHVSFVTGGDVDDYGAWIELESLLEIYNLSLPDVRESEQCLSTGLVNRQCISAVIAQSYVQLIVLHISSTSFDFTKVE